MLFFLFGAACCDSGETDTYVVVEKIEADPSVPYKAGEQIDLYLYSTCANSVLDYVDAGVVEIFIADKSIVDIENGNWVPKSDGITYISCKYENCIKNYNVIVHKGAEYVTSISIAGLSGSTFLANVGQIYQITTENSSACDVSELKIDTYTDYDEVDPDDLVSISANGEIRVVGMGTCEIWVHSASNAADKGARIFLSSSFSDSILSSAVERWIDANIERTQEGVITKAELAEIKMLTFTELLEFDESQWALMLPSLNSVTFDLTAGSRYNAKYNISSGTLAYNFVGAEKSVYKLAIVAQKRERLDLSFNNFSMQALAACVDASAVKDTYITYSGVCSLKAADASDGNGYSAIFADNLQISIAQDSDISIMGGDGSSTSVNGTRVGGFGIRTLGELDIIALSSTHETTLAVYGGDGGDGYGAGNSGGAGGVGVSAEFLSISGTFSCYIAGGTGGDGKTGAVGSAGTNGAKGNNESDGKDPTYGYDGRPGGAGSKGQDGGDGANGGVAVAVARELSVAHNVNLSVQSGDGGNGGNGGQGGKGGKGGDGGDDDKWSFLWIGDMSGGAGGKGGAGGAGGEKGLGGISPMPIFIKNVAASLGLSNVSENCGQSGSDGQTGAKGADGSNGAHGEEGAGG